MDYFDKKYYSTCPGTQHYDAGTVFRVEKDKK